METPCLVVLGGRQDWRVLGGVVMNLDEMLKLVPVPDGINAGMTSARQNTLISLLGKPRDDMTSSCQPVTHLKLKGEMVTRSVGQFRVTGYERAVRSLAEVMAEIALEYPDIYRELGTAGMLCCRHVRGKPHAISNHAWGLAVDLTIGGKLDRYGDGTVQYALTLIAPIFHRHGWHWGASFGKEDGMHFSPSEQTIRRWLTTPTVDCLMIGDRGDEVTELQRLLVATGFQLLVDGDYGPATYHAVRAYQSIKRIDDTGRADDSTIALLRCETADTDPAPPPGES